MNAADGGRVTAAEALQLYRQAPTQCSAGWPTRSAPASIPSASSPTSSTATSTTRTSASRAATSARSTARSASATATCSASRRSSGRSTRRSRVGGNQLLLQGGHNPDLPIAWYEDLFRAVKARYPDVQAARAVAARGAAHLAACRSSRRPRSSTRLIAAGLDSIPGGGAEILVDRVRKLLNCYSKATADEWLGRDAPGAPRRAAHDGDDDVRDGRDRRGAPRAHAAAARAAGRDRRLHRVHHLELSARAHRARRLSRRPASTTCARWRSRASSSTTSTTCRRRG